MRELSLINLTYNRMEVLRHYVINILMATINIIARVRYFIYIFFLYIIHGCPPTQ